VRVQYLSTTARDTVLTPSPACLPHPGLSSCQNRAVWLKLRFTFSVRDGSRVCPQVALAIGWVLAQTGLGRRRFAEGGRAVVPLGAAVPSTTFGYCRFRPSPHVYALPGAGVRWWLTCSIEW